MKKLLYLSILALFTFGCMNNKKTAFTNANGYTFSDDGLTRFTTLIVSDGKVEYRGNELPDDFDGEVRDLEGKTVLPGIIDAHGHVMGLGFQELQVNLAGIRSLEATLDSIKKYAEENPELEWIQGRGWNQELWEDNEFPTAEDLDKVVPDRPI